MKFEKNISLLKINTASEDLTILFYALQLIIAIMFLVIPFTLVKLVVVKPVIYLLGLGK